MRAKHLIIAAAAAPLLAACGDARQAPVEDETMAESPYAQPAPDPYAPTDETAPAPMQDETTTDGAPP
jgi:hypothetical protein